VSVLLPSRGRTRSLRRSVESLRSSASHPDRLSFLVAFDDDDVETGNTANDIGAQPLSFVRVGYSNLHLYYNKLAEFSTGDWLFLWNDDAVMETTGWDSVFGGYDPQVPAVLSPSSTGVEHRMCCFPAMSRCLYLCLGHMSLSCHVDSWLQDLAMSLGILHRLPVHIFHDRFDFTGGHNDQTYAESSAGYRTSEFYSSDMQSLLQLDISKVRSWLP
jgi:hypothetical protein